MPQPAANQDLAPHVEASTNTPEIVMNLPPMYFPMPLRCHPQVELLEERGLAWMTRHGFCSTPTIQERVVGTKSAYFFATLCPYADAELLQLAVDWCYLAFVFDDVHCDEDPTSDGASFIDIAVRIVRTLEDPRAGVLAPRHPFSTPVIDLSERLHNTVSPTLLRRMVDAHRSWHAGVSWEIASCRRAIPCENDYLFTRMLTAAGFVILAWLQLSEHEEIPDHQINAPAVHALTEMAATAGAIDDDLFSYGKDLWFARHHGAPERTHSGGLIGVYMTKEGHTEKQSLQKAVALRDRIVSRFVELRDQVIPEADAPLKRYLDNLTSLIRGNFEFGLMAGRYSNPDGMHPGAVQTLAAVADTPAAIGAPDIPSISWWWQNLL